MAVLLRSQKVSCSAYLKIPQRYLKAGAKLGKLPYGYEALFCRFAHRLVWPVCKVGITKPHSAAHAAPELIKLG